MPQNITPFTNSAIQMMQRAGFTVHFDPNDVHFHRMTMENPPNHDVNYRRRNVYVWRIRDGWRVANVINGYFQMHRTWNSLEEVLEREGPLHLMFQDFYRAAMQWGASHFSTLILPLHARQSILKHYIKQFCKPTPINPRAHGVYLNQPAQVL